MIKEELYAAKPASDGRTGRRSGRAGSDATAGVLIKTTELLLGLQLTSRLRRSLACFVLFLARKQGTMRDDYC